MLGSRMICRLLLAPWLAFWPSAAAVAASDCLLGHSIGVFVAHEFTDAAGATRQGANYGPIYNQLSRQLRSSVASVVEVGAESGKQALERTRGRASLLAFFELVARARDVVLPGGQRTSWQDVELHASLRILDAVGQKQLGTASDAATVAGLSFEDALSTALPGLIDRLAGATLVQTCARSELVPEATPVSESATSRPEQGQNLDSAALNEIMKFATEFCGEYWREGGGEDLSVGGEAQVKLEGLLGRLADMGVSGTGEFSSTDYIGVFREDLRDELKDTRSCRLRIWSDLKGAVTTSN